MTNSTLRCVDDGEYVDALAREPATRKVALQLLLLLFLTIVAARFESRAMDNGLRRILGKPLVHE